MAVFSPSFNNICLHSKLYHFCLILCQSFLTSSSSSFYIWIFFFDLLLANELSISLHSYFIQFSMACFIFILIILYNALYSCKWLRFWYISDLRLSQSSRISSVIHAFVFFLLNPNTCVAVLFNILLSISVVSVELILL